MQIRTATAETVRDRGLWWNVWPINGYPVLVAVDSKGHERKRVVLRPGVDELRAARWLMDVLERLDPLPAPPHLRLVKGLIPPAKPPFDPRAEDGLSHTMRTFRRNVFHIKRLDDR